MKQLPTEDYCYRVPAIRQKGEKNSTANQPEDEFVNLLHVDSLYVVSCPLLRPLGLIELALE